MKHVYIFGAGASAASAGTPLGRDLVWTYPIDCGGLVPYDDNGIPELQEDNERFSNYRRFLALCASIYPECQAFLEKWDNRCDKFFDIHGCLEKRHYGACCTNPFHKLRGIGKIELAIEGGRDGVQLD